MIWGPGRLAPVELRGRELDSPSPEGGRGWGAGSRCFRGCGRFRPQRGALVFLTSAAESQDLSAGYDLGAGGYIREPVSSNPFVSAIESLGRYWLGLNKSLPKVTKL